MKDYQGNKLIKKLFPYLLLLLVFVFKSLQVNNRPLQIQKDSVLYNDIALAIANGSSKVQDKQSPNYNTDIGEVIMPGYPFVVGVVYKLFGNKPGAIKIFQLVGLLFASILFYHLLIKVIRKDLALLAVVWITAYSPHIRTASSLYLECASICMLIVMLYFAHRFITLPTYRNVVLFALPFAILISFNNRFIFHFGIVCLIWLVSLFFSKRYSFKYLFGFGLIVLLFLLPWHVRQYVQYNQFVLFSPFASGHVERTQGKSDVAFTSYEVELKKFLKKAKSTSDSVRVSQEFTKDVYSELVQNQKLAGTGAFIDRAFGFFNLYHLKYHFGFGHDLRLDDPNITARQVLLGWIYVMLLAALLILFTLRLQLKDNRKVWLISYVLVLTLIPIFYKPTDLINIGVLLVFMVPGIYYGMKRKDIFLLFLIVLLAAHILLHSYTHYITRYRLTILPVIFTIAWYGIDQLGRSKTMDAIKQSE